MFYVFFPLLQLPLAVDFGDWFSGAMADSTTKTVAFLAVTLQRACHNSFIESGNPGSAAGCLVGFLFFQKSHHKLSNKKKWGGGTVSGNKLNKSNIPKKTGKLENDLETWVGPYISYPGG